MLKLGLGIHPLWVEKILICVSWVNSTLLFNMGRSSVLLKPEKGGAVLKVYLLIYRSLDKKIRYMAAK